MLNAKATFQNNIQQANRLGTLYHSLGALVPLHVSLDDLLRSQVVNCVSAFDKLMHDLIRIGMVRLFENIKPPTSKYLTESIAIQHLPALAPGAIPPAAIRFGEVLREKFSKLSFQDPIKVADGLSYIWDEANKWQQLSLGLGMSESAARVKLKLIVTRRNAIVHEADLDPVSNAKQVITAAEATDVSNYLFLLGNRICDLVI